MKIAKQIHVILCEDIRQEEGDKISLMGVRQSDTLNVDEIPTILPSVSFMIAFKDSQISLKEFDLIVKRPNAKPDILPFKGANDSKRGTLKLLITMSPFRVKKEGEVKVQIRSLEMKKAQTIYKFQIINDVAID